MNRAFELLEKSAPARGQTQRLPGSTRDAALHDHLYRYAEGVMVTDTEGVSDVVS